MAGSQEMTAPLLSWSLAHCAAWLRTAAARAAADGCAASLVLDWPGWSPPGRKPVTLPAITAARTAAVPAAAQSVRPERRAGLAVWPAVCRTRRAPADAAARVWPGGFLVPGPVPGLRMGPAILPGMPSWPALSATARAACPAWPLRRAGAVRVAWDVWVGWG